MSAEGRGDLTRWNRAGLSRIRYVDGNAATFLETLRLRLKARFPGWAALQRDLPDKETEAQRRTRLLAQYADEQPGDYAWEIARAYARACHVLGEHIDAFANEGFLETATQWETLRALAAMLDYHPAPPASASTLIVLEAKEGKAGLVEKGFQAQHTPPEGGDAVVFETLADMEIDAGLNALRLAGWNRSGDLFGPFEKANHWLPEADMNATAGSLALLLQREVSGTTETFRAAVTKIEAVDPVAGFLSLASVESAPSSGDDWIKGSTRLMLAPKNLYQAKLVGEGVVEMADPPGLSPGEVLAWQDEDDSWQFGLVSQCGGNRLRLASLAPPTLGAALHVAFPIRRRAADQLLLIPMDTLAVAHLLAGTPDTLTLGVGGDFENYLDGSAWRLKDEHSNIAEVYVKDASVGVGELGRVAALPGVPDDWIFAFHGSPSDLASNQWVIGEAGGDDAAAAWYALRIQSMERLDEGFSLVFLNPVAADEVFRGRLRERLRLVELALDEAVLSRTTMKEWVAGNLGTRPASELKGIGHAYYEELGDTRTIAQLAARRGAPPASIPAGLWREFITKAVLVARPGLGPEDCCGLDQSTLAAALQSLAQDPAAGAVPSLRRLHGPFAHELGPVGFDRNGKILEKALEGWLPLDLPPGDPVFQRLKPGRKILVEAGADRQKQAVVVEVGRLGDSPAIRIDPPIIEVEGFSYGETLIRANVVMAGHGERRSERLLGSGDATRLNQAFVFPEAEVSFVADPTQPAGVRADIEVGVDGQIWRQVGSLKDSGPADPHYTVRMTEEGYLKLGFGDGRNGRRLPTGVNNLRITYREGHGLKGNLPAGSLNELVAFHPVAEAVSQPLRAIGGADREDSASLRENAPASLLALERAVSVTDFSDLAVSQGNIWQAAARVDASVAPSREHGQTVKVVVVPAGEVQFTMEERLSPVPQAFLDQQREFLEACAPPGVAVKVEPFDPKLLEIDATVWIKTREYDPYQVIEEVRRAVRGALALRRRKIGRPLHRSELYAVIEAVQGVEHSSFELRSRIIEDGGKLGPATPEPDDVGAEDKQVVFVHEDDRYSGIRVFHKEFRP